MKINKFFLLTILLVGSVHNLNSAAAVTEMQDEVTIEAIKAVCQKCVLRLDDFAKYQSLMGPFFFENSLIIMRMAILYVFGEAKKNQLDQEKMKEHLASLNKLSESMEELLVIFENMIKNSSELGLAA